MLEGGSGGESENRYRATSQLSGQGGTGYAVGSGAACRPLSALVGGDGADAAQPV